MTHDQKPIIVSESIKKIIIWVLSIAMGMEMLDASILNTSFPQIAASFQINPVQLKSALTIYLLALGIFIPVSSWLVDRIGEKYSLLLAIVIFTLGSMGCGFATSLSMMIFFRFLQGVGGAFLMPVGRIMLVRVFKGHDAVKAMAQVTGFGTLGMLIGPLLGGAITTYLNWRWIFFINLPLGLLGLYYIYNYLPALGELKKTKFDLFGFLLIGIGLGALLYICDIAIDQNISIYIKIFLLLISVSAFMLYRIHAKKFIWPLFDLNIFRQKGLMQSAFASFFSRLTLSTQPFLIPLLLQSGYGYTAFKAGLFTIPTALAVLMSKAVITTILKRVDYIELLLVNTLILVMLFCSYIVQAFQLMPIILIIQQFLFGFLAATQFTTMNSLTYQNLEEPYVTQGSSFYSIIIQVSGSFGIALAALVMIMVINTGDLQQHVPFVAFKTVFIVQAIYLLVAQCFFIRLRKIEQGE